MATPTVTSPSSTPVTKEIPMTVHTADESSIHSTGLIYVQYSVDKEERYLPSIRALIAKDLSEPYSIYVYRYFLDQWPELCFLGLDPKPPHPLLAVIISKLEPHPPPHHHSYLPSPPPPPPPAPMSTATDDHHPDPSPQQQQQQQQTPTPRPQTSRGYIAMLAVADTHRRRGIASHLITLSVSLLASLGADEVVLETEVSNVSSLKVYEKLGFLRTKRLHRYYLNGNTAFRLAVYLRRGAGTRVVGGDGGGGNDDEGGGGVVEAGK